MKPVTEISPEELSDWMNDFSVEKGSAVEIWGTEEVFKTIYTSYRDGKKLKTVQDEHEANTLVRKGWTMIAEEGAGDQYDAILVKE